MNAPVKPGLLREVSLDDKFRVADDVVFMSGIQALVRVPLLRRQLDVELGLNTAGFISGYRGSPLGGFDQQLWKIRKLLEQQHIVFRPGINEDLAATAVWGTQQVGLHAGARYDGVFGLWYGKSPGVDRAGDAFKHANFYGTTRHGGVLAVAGDDHSCKSSSMPNQSEFAFIDAEMPILHPADVAEVIEYGLKGIAMSRFSGAWVALKTIADTMDSSATVSISPARYRHVTPSGFVFPDDGVHAREGEPSPVLEARHRGVRLPAAQAFARANGLDRLVYDAPDARFGIACTGKAYLHVMEALTALGIDQARAAQLGLKVYKIGLAWPIDGDGARSFARGLSEVLVIEERRDVVEHQLRAQLYDLPDIDRPRLAGKRDEHGATLVRDTLDLDTAAVVEVLRRRLPAGWIRERAVVRSYDPGAETADLPAPRHERMPMFCSGCPHNRSTRVPEGSRGMAGVGCHFMARWNPARRSEFFTHMGGEGVPWVGEAPFTDEGHIFANLGDGTYFHSGSLAIRQAQAAGVNITFKILFNNAVAMTGGQPVDGTLTVPMVIDQVRAEGVQHIVLVTEDVGRYTDVRLPADVRVEPRDALDNVQLELRDIPGVTVLIYDQMCATERRRQRKRGQLPAEPRKVVINELVCEDCGDCTRQSGCVSITPTNTDIGRARRIDQASCNQDFSCVDGFCPSFVTVEADGAAAPPRNWRDVDLPEPVFGVIGVEPFNLLVTGVGGQGVTSLAAIVGMAAHLESRPVRCVDQTGLAQKGGSVSSHVRIGMPGADIAVARIPPAAASLVLGGDLIVTHGAPVLGLMSPSTRAVLSTDVSPSLQFVLDTDTRYDVQGMLEAIRSGAGPVTAFAIHSLVQRELGDAVYAQVVLMGYAWQRGWLPLSGAALEAAITLNGAQVDNNLLAFRLGRVLAHAPDRLQLGDAAGERLPLSARITRHVEELTAYQDAAYAARYQTLVERVRAAETSLAGNGNRSDSSLELTEAVADALYRLLAVKDEYEVARLFTDGRFEAQLQRELGTPRRRWYHLSPPLVGKGAGGRPRKLRFGGWMQLGFGVLRRMKRLRGTAFDPFSYAAERRAEHELREHFISELDALLPLLNADNRNSFIAWAHVIDDVRGYGPIKAARMAAARPQLDALAANIRYPERIELRWVA